MNLKLHTGRLLAICTLTGFAIGSALVYGYRQLDARTFELGAHASALREAQHLDTQVRTYVHMTDKVLLQDEGGLVNSTIKWCADIRRSAQELADRRLAAGAADEVLAVADTVDAIQELVDEGATHHGADRERVLRELATQAEPLLDEVVVGTEQLGEILMRRAGNLAADVEHDRLLLMVATWIAAIVYAAVVMMSWLWSVQTMVHPIERLSRAAERAKLGDEDFLVEESGPDEVRRLAQNIGSFVRTRADFLATMSHELRTPLNGIINMNELMLGSKLDDVQRELAQSAKSAGESLLTIINDILDFSKIQARKLTLEQASFSLRDAVDAAAELVAAAANSKGLRLTSIVDHALPERVLGDPTRFRQVLVNLLNNAVKFTERGAITVELRRVEDDPGSVRVDVRDTGVGIPADVLPTLFDAFQQGDSSTTRRFGGTGLGLAICRELAALMGGEVGVESESGAGSTFWFTVRLEADFSDTSTTAQRYGCERLVIASAHTEVRRGLLERALALGVDAARIVEVEGCAAATEAASAGDWIAIDPSGVDTALNAVVSELCARVVGRGRVGVLAPMMASRQHVPGADRIIAGARLGDLHEWLSRPATVGSPAADSDAAEPGSALHGRVLIADDNPINRRAARTFLERAGCEVATAENGQDAVDALLSRPFDVVLMDCQMPLLDGFEATRRIRALEKEGSLADGCTRPLKVLALTAATDAEDRAECVRAGMDGLLPKPFAASDLLSAVGDALVRGPSEDGPTPTTRTPRVLIVDDNRMNQRVLAAIVKKAGYETAVVDDGQEAVDHIRSEACDLVLMDCQMPVLDGWEATRVIRELQAIGQLPRGTRAPLPILAVTANAMDGDREKCLDAGMDDYLTKPVKPERVLSTIARHLGRTLARTGERT